MNGNWKTYGIGVLVYFGICILLYFSCVVYCVAVIFEVVHFNFIIGLHLKKSAKLAIVIKSLCHEMYWTYGKWHYPCQIIQ